MHPSDDTPRPDSDAEPNQPAPEPPDDEEKQSHAGGFTLDLSSKKKAQAPEQWRRQRKKADPLTTKIFDLTQPKAPPEPPKPEPKAERKPKGPAKKKGKPKRPAGGATLADLLDPETLARLRGGG
ncbi:MAG: hypothetical protein R3362_03545 [Rhodothermales bacterium]|nr:hypothetical protein [Rhodothermales bacterium]